MYIEYNIWYNICNIWTIFNLLLYSCYISLYCLSRHTFLFDYLCPNVILTTFVFFTLVIRLARNMAEIIPLTLFLYHLKFLTLKVNRSALLIMFKKNWTIVSEIVNKAFFISLQSDPGVKRQLIIQFHCFFIRRFPIQTVLGSSP